MYYVVHWILFYLLFLLKYNDFNEILSEKQSYCQKKQVVLILLKYM